MSYTLAVLLVVGSSAVDDPVIVALRASTAVVALRADDVVVPGRYVHDGFLAGDQLHLFPDRTYVYAEWADIMPLTIFDKGTWSVSGSRLTLLSDTSVTWEPGLDREHLSLRREDVAAEVLLVGSERDLYIFGQLPRDDPSVALGVVARKRTETYTAARAKVVKTRLLRSSWRPSFFDSAKGRGDRVPAGAEDSIRASVLRSVALEWRGSAPFLCADFATSPLKAWTGQAGTDPPHDVMVSLVNGSPRTIARSACDVGREYDGPIVLRSTREAGGVTVSVGPVLWSSKEKDKATVTVLTWGGGMSHTFTEWSVEQVKGTWELRGSRIVLQE